jgi:tRNA pseudouridine38/39 synthase
MHCAADSRLLSSLCDLLFPGQSATLAALATRLRTLADELEQPSRTNVAAGKPCAEADASEPLCAEATAFRGPPAGAARRAARAAAFDLSRYPSQLVALEVFYAGWPYHGFATQGDGPGCAETVETHLFAALRTTRLVAADASWASVEYSRCGRTDRGVSALRQLVALRVRSAPPGTAPLDYVGSLNRALPADVRVLSWRPAPAGFSARFSARWRQYKYFFWQDGSLDTHAMADAAARFVGVHDFRNVCKMDVDCVANYVRTIHSFSLQPEPDGNALASAVLPPPAPGSGAQLWSLNVRGSAFLWHQVRCMASLLFMVGRCQEQPSVVSALLDVAQTPGKPAYDMAAEEPLLFYACGYDDEAGAGALQTTAAPTPPRTVELLREHLCAQARGAAVRARIFRLALEAVEAAAGDRGAAACGRHVPLMQRRVEASYEEQLARRPAGKSKLRLRTETAGDGD